MFRRTYSRALHMTILAVLMSCFAGQAAEYQWSVPVEAVLSTETSASPQAWLWIPSSCKQVRAVIVGQHNLLEETVFDNAIFREALAENDMAIVWVSPAFDSLFRADLGGGEVFNAMMKALAHQSGYSELEWAPVIPIGHSAMAGYPYQFAAWNPERTLAAISIKGTTPDGRGPADFKFDNSRLNGVPLLFINGEYEDAEGRAGKAANFRKNFPKVPLTMLADSGGGHFDFSDRLARYIALYLRKVSQYRLPEKSPLSGAVPLKTVDPTQSGWLYDRFRVKAMPKAVPAALNAYAGPKDEAFWAFDEELAKATDAYALQYRLKQPQLAGYLQNGELQPVNPKRHEGVVLKVAPQSDGTTFKIAGTFLETVPEGGATGWRGLPAGSAITHSPNGVPVKVDVITGPLKKVADDTFVLQFGRIGFNNGKRSGAIWLQATHDGDDEYKRCVQQAALNIPIKNTSGALQSLSFESIPDQTVGVSSLPLQVVSSAQMPVSFYVKEGPAEVDGGILKIRALPPRAKLPVRVTVVAYQWGRSIEPRLQSATPVSRTFYLLGQGQKAPAANELQKNKSALTAIWEEAAQKIAALPAVSVATKNPADFGRSISFNFAKDLGMAQSDMAGDVLRASNWNNLTNLKAGSITEVRNVLDSSGNTIPLTLSFSGGTVGGSNSLLDLKSEAASTSNDARLFNGVYDQNEGTPTTITVFGIPFARYDVIFYRADDGPQRAGRFQLGNRVLFARGGKGTPDGEGLNYTSAADASYGQGIDIEQGNVVRFQNLTDNRFTASFQAVFAGDNVQRNKVAGFQIVERK